MHRILPALVLGAALLIAGCATVDEPSPPLQDAAAENDTGFAHSYTFKPLEFTPSAPQYALPLDPDTVTNWEEVVAALDLGEEEQALLKEHGFVVAVYPFGDQDEIVGPYKALGDQDVPLFLSSDTLLHLYHAQFDDTLRRVEEREFFDDLRALDTALLNASEEAYRQSSGEAKEAARLNMGYYAVALTLLAPDAGQVGDSFGPGDVRRYHVDVPAPVRAEVEAELALIDRKAGLTPSPLFSYTEDYSQYRPRGHYTQSERLKNYFQAMMWHGRMPFLLNATRQVPEEEARVQTAAAARTAALLADDPDLMERWDRIYEVTAFYVGYADDLGPEEYIAAMERLFGGVKQSLAPAEVDALRRELLALDPPAIYSGTGYQIVESPEEARRVLNATQGFRFMGQRFVPDSYFFSELVFPYTGEFTGTGEPFTLVGGYRSIPTGLDVMALLGSEQARTLLDEGEDSAYAKYDPVYGRLEGELAALNESAWRQNLYWGWLYSLRPLLVEFGEGYPTFMQTPAWQEKELTTSLASWTELRHDTILYVKQSYTLGKGPATSPEKPEIPGYVEPVPEAYHRLGALNAMTADGLFDLDVLDPAAQRRLRDLGDVVDRFTDLSVKELEGVPLTAEDHAFIRDAAESLDDLVINLEARTTLVADVHSDPYDDIVLEEGVGYVDLIVVACPEPDGAVTLCAGPVLSYYEFKHPLDDRLTDEAWREMLREAPPARPWWTGEYAVVA
ncbi:DUF3160 domain-containing protein [Methanofollis formosanus]|uniref:DUF3160 domain-containing protein n=1 Tax=Methanofollis formosanus TaxID=299308 RepID=A0A8G1A488_9EURY|nr:DUF3160 domain-containing protein [Methanofollis formosanus]QYZ79782.1 DUF3160 domain-containing protein [Methanofollis formosanus]